MKDFSSYGYMQGPIKAMVVEDLHKMGIVVQAPGTSTKRRSKTHQSYVNMTQLPAHDKSIYGKPLHELETRPVPGQPYIRVPRLLLRSCNFLSHHITTEGLFRKSGSVARQKVIRTSLNEGHSINEDANPHDVANLLKQFLRELPEPLVTFELYDAFIQTQSLSLEEDKIQCMLLLCLMLPDINRHTLQFLVKFLQTVSEHHLQNKMSVSNLAVVNTPNVIWGPHKDGSRIRLETKLMECLIQAGSELGLVPEDIAHRAHSMLLELSGIWGVSQQEAATKLPGLKGKRKRSGSLSGILTSVFKNNRPALRSSKRKSFSNQDLTEVRLKDQHVSNTPDLSYSTPCIIKRPAPPTSLITTPLLNAKRRTALLRQTPVDPRKKPKTHGDSGTECESPLEMDPPKKRSKFDFSPKTEPVDKKRKNFKQRLSEGLSSRYRKSRLKRKRARGSSASDIPAAHQVVTDLSKRKREKTPVFCFKAKPGSFNDQQERGARRISSGSTSDDVLVNQCTRYLESPVQPELVQYTESPGGSSLDSGSQTNVTPGLDKMKHLSTYRQGKKLFPSPLLLVDSDEEAEVRPQSPISPPVSDVQLKRNNSYLQSWKCTVARTSDTPPGTELGAELPRRSPRLRRSVPVCGPSCQVQDTRGPVRRSPRLSGDTPQYRELPAKTRTLSGNSYTVVKHRVDMNAVSAHHPPDTVYTSPGNTSLNNSLNMAALITPQTFSRSSRKSSRSSERTHKVLQAEPRQSFSPIRMSLRNITPGHKQDKMYPPPPPPPPQLPASDALVLTTSTLREAPESRELSMNLTELFTSRDITRLDMSLNVSQFDKNFKIRPEKTVDQISEEAEGVSLDDSMSDLCRNNRRNNRTTKSQTETSFVQTSLDSVLCDNDVMSRDFAQTSTIVSDNPTEIFSSKAASYGKLDSIIGASQDLDSGLGSRTSQTDFGQSHISTYITHDESDLSHDDSRVSHDDSDAFPDDSRVTYITQNQSSFFHNNTINQSSVSIIPYPKIDPMPDLIALSLNEPIILQDKPNLITPPPYSAKSHNFVMTSQIGCTNAALMTSQIGCTNAALNPASCASSSTTNIRRIPDTETMFGCGIAGDRTLSPPESAYQTPPETMSRIPSEPMSQTPSSEIPIPARSQQHIVTLPNRLITHDTGSAPGNTLITHDTVPGSSPGAAAISSLPLPPGVVALSATPGTTTQTPSTPLTYAERQQTYSKAAVVTSQIGCADTAMTSQIGCTDTAMTSQIGCKGRERRARPDFSSVIVQDDQVSSSSSSYLDTASTSNKENLLKTPGKDKESALAKTPGTPKANTELDTTKINITPRTKISKGFTKNLASQWESMNTRSTKASVRVSRTNTQRGAAKSRVLQSAAVSTRSNSENGRGAGKPAPRTPTRRGAGALRHVRTATRTVSARNPRVGGLSANKNIIRAKSDNSIRTPGLQSRAAKSKTVETPKPAWRF